MTRNYPNYEHVICQPIRSLYPKVSGTLPVASNCWQADAKQAINLFINCFCNFCLYESYTQIIGMVLLINVAVQNGAKQERRRTRMRA